MARAASQVWHRLLKVGPVLSADDDASRSWTRVEVTEWLLYSIRHRKVAGLVMSTRCQGAVYWDFAGACWRFSTRFVCWCRVMWRRCADQGLFVMLLIHGPLAGDAREAGRLVPASLSRHEALFRLAEGARTRVLSTPALELGVLQHARGGGAVWDDGRLLHSLGKVVRYSVERRKELWLQEWREEMKRRDLVYVADVMNSVKFRPHLQVDFPKEKRGEHVNVLESDTVGLWSCSMVRSGIEGTGLLFLDSGVATCANAKGRSPAPRLRHSVRRNGSTHVAGGLYPGYTWGRSAWNTGDDPSRHKKLRDPRWPKPQWLLKAEQGDLAMLKWVTTLPAQGARWLHWARFVLRFLGG